MRRLKSILSIFILMLFLFPFSARAESAPVKPVLNYVALGDSLAAGFLNSGTIGNGYPVFIKQKLEENAGYTVQLINEGVGGYTTTDVLNQLNNEKVKEAIGQAGLITLDIGANDILKKVGTNPDVSDPETVTKVVQTIPEIKANVQQILQQIKTLNPNAPIYLMGYYNALPYIDGQLAIVLMINGLNAALQGAAGTMATFVPTFDLFDGNYETYLPNQNNIHPNEAGYRAIAGRFVETILPSFIKEVEPGSQIEVKANQRIFIQGTKTVLTMPADLPNGTQLYVKKVQTDAIEAGKDLELAGEAWEFSVIYPDGKSPAQSYYLTMGYDKEKYKSEQVDIYAEDHGQWVKQNGLVNEADGTVTVNASTLSTFAVFAKAPETSDGNGGTNDGGNQNGNGDNGGQNGTADNGSQNGTSDQDGHNQTKPEGQTDTSSEEQGGRLPDTAGTYPFYIAVGGLITASGAVLVLKGRKTHLNQ